MKYSDVIIDDIFPSRNYNKLSLYSDCYDGGIYIDNTPYKYAHSINEELIDSKGNKHSIEIGREIKEYKLINTIFYFEKWGRKDDPNWDCIKYDYCPIELRYLFFQFNLKNYMYIYGEDWDSSLTTFRSVTYGYFNDAPSIFYVKDFRNRDAMKESGFAPLYEKCFGKECNFIPDRLFFNHPNRQLALNRICAGIPGSLNIKDDIFKNFDYVNASDKELLKFMNDRFQKRMKYESYIQKHHHYFTN